MIVLPSRVAPGDGAGCRARAPGGRSPRERGDCAAVLAGGARRTTHCAPYAHYVRCVRFVQTGCGESEVEACCARRPACCAPRLPPSCPRPAPHPVTGGSGGVGVRCESRLLGARCAERRGRSVKRPCAVDAPTPPCQPRSCWPRSCAAHARAPLTRAPRVCSAPRCPVHHRSAHRTSPHWHPHAQFAAVASLASPSLTLVPEPRCRPSRRGWGGGSGAGNWREARRAAVGAARAARIHL